MAFTEDLSDFINPDTPGYVVAIILGEPVGGLYDRFYIDEYGVASSNPTLLVKTADVPAIALNTIVDIASVNFKVCEPPQPDNLGLVRLELALASWAMCARRLEMQ